MPELPPIEIRSYSKGYGQPETGLSNQSAMQFATARAEQLQQREMRDMNMRHAGSAIEKYFGSNAPLISAMLGNIDVETGGTFDFQQKQKGGNGYGLFQTSKDPMKLSDDIMNIFLRPGVPHAERRRESSRMHSLAITPAK